MVEVAVLASRVFVGEDGAELLGFMYGVGLPLIGCCWFLLLNPCGVADPGCGRGRGLPI